MGTFHIIDGCRVRVYYPGNRKTCARCHQTADICKGDAVAKDCEANGGSRVDINDHMQTLWEKVGFSPVELSDGAPDTAIDQRDNFSPKISHPGYKRR